MKKAASSSTSKKTAGKKTAGKKTAGKKTAGKKTTTKKPPPKTSYTETTFPSGNRFPMRPSARFAGVNKKTGKVIPHKPNAETALQVETLASVGLSDKEIAVALNIRPGLIRQHYGEVIDSAPVETNFRVAIQVRNLALGGDCFPASAFWLTHRAKWTNKLELSGPDGKPISASVLLYLPKNGREKD